MPDIKNPVQFTAELKKIITAKLKDKKFASTDWSSQELLDLRVFIRNHYRNEQKGICVYCLKDVSLQSALNSHVEHIVPKSRDLKFIFEPTNLCVICADCNTIKRDQEVLKEEENTIVKKDYKLYPRSSSAFKIYHPHFDKYEDHIEKIGDFYIDKSSKGSYTITICKLNRKSHEFGIDFDLLSQPELLSLMNEYTSDPNSSKGMKNFNKIREYCIKIS